MHNIIHIVVSDGLSTECFQKEFWFFLKKNDLTNILKSILDKIGKYIP